MQASLDERDTLFILFGAGGDLSQRLIIPALFNLYLDRQLPQRFVLHCIDRSDYSNEALAEHFLQGVTRDSTNPVHKERWQEFAKKSNTSKRISCRKTAMTGLTRPLRKKRKNGKAPLTRSSIWPRRLRYSGPSPKPWRIPD